MTSLEELFSRERDEIIRDIVTRKRADGTLVRRNGGVVTYLDFDHLSWIPEDDPYHEKAKSWNERYNAWLAEPVPIPDVTTLDHRTVVNYNPVRDPSMKWLRLPKIPTKFLDTSALTAIDKYKLYRYYLDFKNLGDDYSIWKDPSSVYFMSGKLSATEYLLDKGEFEAFVAYLTTPQLRQKKSGGCTVM